ncbi:CPBP family intramembrane glutamic endopeptidase [Psychrobacillus sp. BM2]|uniref:CPBP family intramembrane glutamic endopeptidase n=1 Tax=Psychrobacillus sp. BM2 TaxID=3400421 RepID=UPI003B0249F9
MQNPLTGLISSLIFTIAHFPTLNAMLVNFINGVVFAWVYEKTFRYSGNDSSRSLPTIREGVSYETK